MINKKFLGALFVIFTIIFGGVPSLAGDKIKDTIKAKKFSAANNTEFRFYDRTNLKWFDRGDLTMVYGVPKDLIDGNDRSKAVYYAQDLRTGSKKYHRTKYNKLVPNKKYKLQYDPSNFGTYTDTHSTIAKIIDGGYDLLDHRGDVIVSVPNAKRYDVQSHYITPTVDGYYPMHRLGVFELDMDGQTMFQVVRLVDNPGIVSPPIPNIKIEKRLVFIAMDNGDVWPFKPTGELAGDDPHIVGFEPQHKGGLISKYVYEDGTKLYGLVHFRGAKVTGPQFKSLEIVDQKSNGDGRFIGQTVEGEWQVWGVDVISDYDPTADMQGLISVSSISKSDALRQLAEAERRDEIKRQNKVNQINAEMRAREAEWAAERRAKYEAYLKDKAKREDRERRRNKAFCESTHEKAEAKTYSQSTPLLRASMFCDDFLTADQIDVLVNAANDQKTMHLRNDQPGYSNRAASTGSQPDPYAAVNAQWSNYWQQYRDYNSGKSAYNPDRK